MNAGAPVNRNPQPAVEKPALVADLDQLEETISTIAQVSTRLNMGANRLRSEPSAAGRAGGDISANAARPVATVETRIRELTGRLQMLSKELNATADHLDNSV